MQNQDFAAEAARLGLSSEFTITRRTLRRLDAEGAAVAGLPCGAEVSHNLCWHVVRGQPAAFLDRIISVTAVPGR